MQTERRIDEKRIDIHRPVQVVAGDELTCEGYTKNLSEEGVRARFETRMEPGANVLVRLSLVDGADPVEKRARIVWSAPDLYGDGIEVGLRLLEGQIEDPAASEEGSIADPVPAGETHAPFRLNAGQLVEVETGGIGIVAFVEKIGEIDDDGTISVTLSLDENDLRAADDGEYDEMLDEEHWKPRPFRDAYRRVMRYAGPVLSFIWRFLSILLVALGRGIAWLWRKLPRRVTAGPERAWEALALKRRLGSLSRRLLLATRSIASRLAPPKHARQTGD